MKINLQADVVSWQEIAREFADNYLQPNEIEAELNQGRLAPALAKKIKDVSIELGFSGMDVPKKYGGKELSTTAQVAIWEQLGRTTNALSWCFAEPQQWMFDACSEEQIQKYILPLMHGDKHDCYAITEAGPGSDAATLESTAQKVDDGYLLDGEKWFVTSGNLAHFFWFQGNLIDAKGNVTEQALFFVDKDTPGIEITHTPLFSHTFAAHHPIYRFNQVKVPLNARVGDSGDGMAYTRAWFRRERLMIAARCCGASARLIEDATEFAKNREVGGEPLAHKQAIQAMLADSVTDLYAARLMTFDTAAAHDRGEDIKILHGRCSMAKLFASEMANKTADRAVQIFGGRGYMRENVAERFFRELRVDRIWEGTSEIQRIIIARLLVQRGMDGL